MIRPRLSIRALIMVIALAAAECALFRSGFGEMYLALLLNTIALPMTTILLFMFSRQQALRKRGEHRPDLTGFQVAGWASLVAVVALLIGVPEAYVAVVWMFDPVRQFWFDAFSFRPEMSTPTKVRISIWCLAETSLYVSISIALNIVMLMIASLGGRLGSRQRGTQGGRVTSVRRSATVPPYPTVTTEAGEQLGDDGGERSS